MKKLLSILFVIGFNYSVTKAQCPPGAFAYQSSYAQCASGCGVLLIGWPAGVLVNIYGGTPLTIITNAIISGTLGSGKTGDAFVCVPCNITLVFASSAVGASTGCVIAVIGVVPVKLNSFSVTSNNYNNYTLNWTASQESGKVKYVAQRSNDGSNFTELATIVAKDNGQSGSAYSYEDAAVSQLINYYRLKIIEVSGNISFSEIVIAKKKAGSGISVYPNPVDNNFKVNIPENLLPAYVEILDAQGKRAYYNKAYQSLFSIQSQLKNGVYALRVTGNNNISITQKIIKK